MVLASEKGSFELAKYLVENGSNINEKNQDGYIPLHLGNK